METLKDNDLQKAAVMHDIPEQANLLVCSLFIVPIFFNYLIVC